MADNNGGSGEGRPRPRKSWPITGVAAATTGVGGFAFGLFGQLKLADLIAQQSAYALTILALASALILATGRATIPMQGRDAHWAIDGLIAFCVFVAGVGVYKSFEGPRETNIYMRFEPNLADETDPPKLSATVYLGYGYKKIISEDPVPVSVSQDGEVSVSVKNLPTLLSQYHLQLVRSRTEGERFQNLRENPAEKDDVP